MPCSLRVADRSPARLPAGWPRPGARCRRWAVAAGRRRAGPAENQRRMVPRSPITPSRAGDASAPSAGSVPGPGLARARIGPGPRSPNRGGPPVRYRRRPAGSEPVPPGSGPRPLRAPPRLGAATSPPAAAVPLTAGVGKAAWPGSRSQGLHNWRQTYRGFLRHSSCSEGFPVKPSLGAFGGRWARQGRVQGSLVAPGVAAGVAPGFCQGRGRGWGPLVRSGGCQRVSKRWMSAVDVDVSGGGR